MNEEKLNALKNETKKINGLVRKQITGYILGGLGVIVGLSWNDAIKSLIEAILPPTKGGLEAKFIYAFILTLIVALVSIYVIRNQDENS